MDENKKTIDELMNEVAIKEAIAKLNAEPGEEAWLEFVGQLILRIVEGGLVPAPFQSIPYIVWGVDPNAELNDVLPADRKEENIALLVDGKGLYWLPLYTSRDEIKQDEGITRVEFVPIREVFENAVADNGIEGILLNPESDSIAIRKELIGLVLDMADKQNSEAG